MAFLCLLFLLISLTVVHCHGQPFKNTSSERWKVCTKHKAFILVRNLIAQFYHWSCNNNHGANPITNEIYWSSVDIQVVFHINIKAICFEPLDFLAKWLFRMRSFKINCEVLCILIWTVSTKTMMLLYFDYHSHEIPNKFICTNLKTNSVHVCSVSNQLLTDIHYRPMRPLLSALHISLISSKIYGTSVYCSLLCYCNYLHCFVR